MLRLTAKTRLKPEEVMKKALDFFGAGGCGLKVAEQSNTCASFEGASGSVFITACSDGKRTKVDMETMEWEYQVKEFARKI
ncbi:MAG: hypothetical protein A2144_05465 [Chloroflexi bacterium RBG_16_50_9]|nr:MAG: hypothetical protein A2144_05465 [Chloroflexi bacterium RBG_16_50_9]